MLAYTVKDTRRGAQLVVVKMWQAKEHAKRQRMIGFVVSKQPFMCTKETMLLSKRIFLPFMYACHV